MEMRRMIAAAALLALPFLAFSAPKSDSGFIKKKDGKNIEDVSEMTADAEGNITYKVDKIQTQIKKREYDFAWIPKPDDIKEADRMFKDKNFAGALEAYTKLYSAYKFIGWDAYCLYKEGDCLVELGRKDEAMKKLEEVKALKIEDSDKQGDYQARACNLLANLYLEKGDTKNADELLAKVAAETENENVSAQALVNRGDLLLKMNNKKEAALMYLRVALMFPKSNKHRAEAICKAANTLKDQNDARSAKYAALLKKDYPDSPFIKELK